MSGRRGISGRRGQRRRRGERAQWAERGEKGGAGLSGEGSVGGEGEERKVWHACRLLSGAVATPPRAGRHEKTFKSLGFSQPDHGRCS